MVGVDMATALWWAVVVSGIYHGINPAMGWPLAVSAALMDRAQGSLFKAVGALAAGHLVAMAAILFPFTVLLFLAQWQREIQIAAACLVIGLGILDRAGIKGRLGAGIYDMPVAPFEQAMQALDR